MRLSLFDKFGALNSAPVFAAFARALDRHGIPRCHHDINADVAVIWSVVWAGRMRKNQAIFEHFRSQGRPVVVLEVGMLRRGVTWKIGINGIGRDSRFCTETDPDRPNKLKIHLEPWRRSGSDVVIFCQREDSQQWHGQPEPHQWLDRVVKDIRTVTDRPIVVRPHPRRPAYAPAGTHIVKPRPIANTYDDYDLDTALNQAWCAINHNSGPGPLSVLGGVPVFCDHSSLAAPVASLDLAKIEQPVRPDREQWLQDFCHTEWTLPEIEQGNMLDQLLKRLQSI